MHSRRACQKATGRCAACRGPPSQQAGPQHAQRGRHAASLQGRAINIACARSVRCITKRQARKWSSRPGGLVANIHRSIHAPTCHRAIVQAIVALAAGHDVKRVAVAVHRGLAGAQRVGGCGWGALQPAGRKGDGEREALSAHTDCVRGWCGALAGQTEMSNVQQSTICVRAWLDHWQHHQKRNHTKATHWYTLAWRKPMRCPVSCTA